MTNDRATRPVRIRIEYGTSTLTLASGCSTSGAEVVQLERAPYGFSLASTVGTERVVRGRLRCLHWWRNDEERDRDRAKQPLGDRAGQHPLNQDELSLATILRE